MISVWQDLHHLPLALSRISLHQKCWISHVSQSYSFGSQCCWQISSDCYCRRGPEMTHRNRMVIQSSTPVAPTYYHFPELGFGNAWIKLNSIRMPAPVTESFHFILFIHFIGNYWTVCDWNDSLRIYRINEVIKTGENEKSLRLQWLVCDNYILWLHVCAGSILKLWRRSVLLEIPP